MVYQRLDLTFQIEFKSSWHIGSGFRSAAASRLVRRMPAAKGGGNRGQEEQGADIPYVPGSQIKGVLRHQCERICLASGLDSLAPHATSAAQQTALVQHFVPLRQNPLLPDRLLGTRFQGACLFVSNALPVNGASGSSVLRTRTAVDRVTRTVREGHLFTTERMQPQTVEGRIRARHPAGILTVEKGGFPHEYSLLLAALLSITTLGGEKGCGLGQCEIRIVPDSLKWNGAAIALRDALANLNETEWGDLVAMIREENQQ